MNDWIKLFNNDISLNVQTKVTPTKGNLVYEYNPFRNYRINQNMYEYQGGLYSLGDLWKHFNIGLKIHKAIRYGDHIYTYYIFPNENSVPERDDRGDWWLGEKKLNSEELVDWIKNKTPFYSEKTEDEIKYEEINNKIADTYYERNILRLSDWLYDAKVPEPNKTEFITGSDNFGEWIKDAYKDGNNINRKNLEEALIRIKFNEGWINVPDTISAPYLREAGELTDFISDELNFSLSHPVHIIPQHSYDGSVNLIINDGLNVPRLINSRFSATGRNTYEVVDRKGNNDTNIYDQGEQFDIDTSLYKRVIKIPKIDFKGVSAGGNLKVGNYHFYFKLSDADGNETDFVGESGLVSIFIGFSDYHSVTTGEKNQNSFKQVNFQLTNIDSSYDYVTVYYSRNTAEGLENSVTEYIKIDKKYSVNNAEVANIVITGYENTINISPADINLNYNIVDNAYTSASCQNMLFMGNIHKPDIPYRELSDLSLRFLPYLKEEDYAVDIDHEYYISTFNRGYIDPKFIYDKTGYWGNEIYRFGIVYILKNGELSPVFNVRGNYNIGEFNNTPQYSNIPVWEEGEDPERRYINYHEEKYILLEEDSGQFENIKGVVSFNPTKDTNTIYSVDFRVDDDTIQELKKHVRGYFFVRQTRIPTILAQGITIGIDKESHTPTIPTAAGFLDEFTEDDWKMTHVTTEDINNVNYISEGFLSRYTFEFKKTGGIWGWIGAVVATIALVAAAVFSFGAAAPASAVGLGGIFGALATASIAVGSTAGIVITGITTAAAIGAAVAVGAIYEGVIAIQYAVNNGRAKKSLNGRETKPPASHKIAEVKDSRKLDQDFSKRFIPKDPSKNIVAGILCPDYELNQPYYNQIFTGNNHLIQLTKSQNINCLNGFSSNYFTNNSRHFYVPDYFDRNIQNGYTFKIIGVPDSVKCIGIDNMLFRARAGEAEEAWRYECIGDNHETKLDLDDFKDGENIDPKEINSDIIRGNFGAYLAFNDEGNSFQPAETVNIYIPEYSIANMEEYFYLRMTDNSTFFAITDRYDIQNIDDHLVAKYTGLVGTKDRSQGYHINAYRGDCYLCQFTHRVNRNFNDPSAPYNDEIVDENTWRDNYQTDSQEKYQKINLGDVNAIQLGMWVTFKVRSSYNLNIRTLDNSHVDEEAMSGHPRGYYPYFPMSTEGTYKTPDSQIYNKGFSKSVSERWNFEIPDVPHIKNWFGTRIIYSDIHINDAFKNGFRVFRGTNYRDYTREYGEIVKLISLQSNLLCVFEHGVALIPVNERAVAGQGSGGNVYINTSNVLPENPRIISDMFGSQWPESIIKVPGKTGSSAQYVYGVDTVAKKIWRTDGNILECISDFKVQEFLNNNITLGERELTPIIGVRNVKTHYNAFKRDVMFTFYDNTYGFEEKVWNLCWNEILEKFVTFYSWVPSYMENINNIPFSFDRNTSKWIAKLGTSHTENSFADGITLSNVVINNDGTVNNKQIFYSYITSSGNIKTNTVEPPEGLPSNFIGMLSLNNRVLPDYQVPYVIKYSLERDIYGNHDKFEIKPIANFTLGAPDAMFKGQNIIIYGLFFKDDYSVNDLFSELYYRNSKGNSYSDVNDNKKNYIRYDEETYKPAGLDSIALNLPIFKDKTGKRPMLGRNKMLNPDKLVTLLNIKASIDIQLPSGEDISDYYYNLQSGYNSDSTLINMGQYESTVAIIPQWNMQFLTSDFWKHGQAGIIDIADDIKPTIWYGKQHPFEFEVVVINDPAVHKIFTNLEIVANKAKPESFHYEVIGETYDFAKDKPNMYFRQEALKALWQYNGADISYNRNFLKIEPKKQSKSADLIRKYYSRQDTINEIEDYYLSITQSTNHDYRHLSGGEIVYYPNRQEYRIQNHVKAVDIADLDQDNPRSIISANCQYLEDKWNVTINPLLVCYKNEESWAKAYNNSSKLPVLPIYNSPVPDKILEKNNIEFPDKEGNALYNLYDLSNFGKDGNWKPLDLTNWLDDNNFGESWNRKEVDVRDKFIKIRIRYSGEELAIIDFLKTIYQVSYA